MALIKVLQLQKPLYSQKNTDIPRDKGKEALVDFRKNFFVQPCYKSNINSSKGTWKQQIIIIIILSNQWKLRKKIPFNITPMWNINVKQSWESSIYPLLPLWAVFHLPNLHSDASSTNWELVPSLQWVKRPLYFPEKRFPLSENISITRHTFVERTHFHLLSLKCSSAVKLSALLMIPAINTAK